MNTAVASELWNSKRQAPFVDNGFDDLIVLRGMAIPFFVENPEDLAS